MGYVPRSPADEVYRRAMNRMGRLRWLMGRRKSLSGKVASAVLYVVRPMVPSWRRRVRRIRGVLIKRGMVRMQYWLKHGPHPTPPPAPPRAGTGVLGVPILLPGGVIEFEKELTRETRARIRAEWQAAIPPPAPPAHTDTAWKGREGCFVRPRPGPPLRDT